MSFKFYRYFNQKFFSLIFNLFSKVAHDQKNFKSYGKKHGKYFLPDLKDEKKKQWIISAGVGDDISFDIDMLNLGYNLIFIDPTPLAVKYFKKNFDYNLYDKKFIFYEKGLWNEKTNLNFYSSDSKADINSDEYIISNTISNYNKSKNSIKIETTTISEIMRENKIEFFFLIKLDIEGSELEVINHIYKKNIKPNYLLIEFDFLKQQSLLKAIKNLFFVLKKLKKLEFQIIYIDNLNFTFKRKI